MSGIDGLELQRQLTARRIELPVIVMTGHADVSLAVAAMKAGAVDFIEKPFTDEILLSAVRIAIDREAVGRREGEDLAALQARIQGLTARETEVLDGLASGHPNKLIAYHLQISARTVEVHRANLMHKMQTRSLSELVRMVLAVQAAARSPDAI